MPASSQLGLDAGRVEGLLDGAEALGLRLEQQRVLLEVLRGPGPPAIAIRHRALEAALDAYGLGVLHDPSRQLPGRHAVLEGHHAAAHRHPVAGRALHPPADASGQVVDELGWQHLDLVKVDDVHVGLQAGPQLAAVRPHQHRRSGAGELVHHRLDGEELPAGPVAAPVADHCGRRGCVAEQLSVCPAVSEPGDDLRVQQHLLQRLHVVCPVIVQRPPEDAPVLRLRVRQHVVADLVHGLPRALRHRREGVLLLGLVVRRPWPDEVPRVSGHHDPDPGVVGPLLLALREDGRAVDRVLHALREHLHVAACASPE
mmetsp:Transcript_67135/g.189108  ORF Transcript_67135/g.189108 Transcript_67135/m.189108 type:complete len:314 (+) Transcript_67135:92-1033(+)